MLIKTYAEQKIVRKNNKRKYNLLHQSISYWTNTGINFYLRQFMRWNLKVDVDFEKVGVAHHRLQQGTEDQLWKDDGVSLLQVAGLLCNNVILYGRAWRLLKCFDVISSGTVIHITLLFPGIVESKQNKNNVPFTNIALFVVVFTLLPECLISMHSAFRRRQSQTRKWNVCGAECRALSSISVELELLGKNVFFHNSRAQELCFF